MNRDDLLGANTGYGYGACLRFDQIVDTSPPAPKPEPAVERDVSWRERAAQERVSGAFEQLGKEFWADFVDNLVKSIPTTADEFKRLYEQRPTPAPYTYIPTVEAPLKQIKLGAAGGGGYVYDSNGAGCGGGGAGPNYTPYERVTVDPERKVVYRGTKGYSTFEEIAEAEAKAREVERRCLETGGGVLSPESVVAHYKAQAAAKAEAERLRAKVYGEREPRRQPSLSELKAMLDRGEIESISWDSDILSWTDNDGVEHRHSPPAPRIQRGIYGTPLIPTGWDDEDEDGDGGTLV